MPDYGTEMSPLRIGIDVGGTFTDLVAYWPHTHALFQHKVLTTPQNPVSGILKGLQELLRNTKCSHHDFAKATIIHGTTLVTNALIERKGRPTALLTTQGARDILETGKENRYDPYDRLLVRPPPLVPRALRFPVHERITTSGTVSQPLDDAEVIDILTDLAQQGVEAVAVCFLHSYANPIHERQIRDIAERLGLRLYLSLSSDIAPVIGEVERLNTTAANAYILPLVDHYLRDFRQALTSLGHQGNFYLMWSSGGLASLDATLQLPLQLLESGPAAGTLAAQHLTQDRSSPVIASDMGGTTAKICLIQGNEPARTSSFEIGRVHRHKPGSGITVRLPSVQLLEIGAGGGSIGSTDDLGLLKVGPESAGSRPGPACYGLGGVAPTVTDANLVLGYLSEGTPLAGGLKLEAAAARSSLAPLAKKLQLSTDETARGIRRVVTENMSQAMKLHVTEQGEDPRRYTLMAFGGAAPFHAYDLARTLDIHKVIFPNAAGVLSALGLLTAGVSVELVQSFITPLKQLRHPDLRNCLESLKKKASTTLHSAGTRLEHSRLHFSLDMRYHGQGYEIQVAIDPESDLDVASLEQAFTRAYRDLYGVTYQGDVDIRACRLRAVGPKPNIPASIGQTSTAKPRVNETRSVWFEDAADWLETPVFQLETLNDTDILCGPALIETPHTTFVVGPQATLSTSPNGDLVMEMTSLKEVKLRHRDLSNPVELEILTARLRGIADEADRTLLRTAFSSAVRDGKDYSLVIADLSGNCLGLPTECMPLFVSSMPRTIHLLTERFPPDTLHPGDILLTNDPWLGAGHKSDIVLVAPVFHENRAVAFVGTILHVADIGGALGDFRAWDIFEEGLALPPVKLYEKGQLNGAVQTILAANVRTPQLVLGDIAAMQAAMDVAATRLKELLESSPGLELSYLSSEIATRTTQAFRKQLGTIPAGTYQASLDVDGPADSTGAATPIHLELQAHVTPEELTLDFTDSDAERPRQPINVPLSYTLADSIYAIQYMLAPNMPNIGPQFNPIVVCAPEKSILNAQSPMPVFARTRTGLHIATLIAAALAPAVPHYVQAGCGHNVIVTITGTADDNQPIHLTLMPKGGMGATSDKDGWDCTVFPTNCTMISSEIAETLCPIFISREMRIDSGGPGKYRGGTGQKVTLESRAAGPIIVGFRPNFVDHPPIGLLGGLPGRAAHIEVNGRPLTDNPVILQPGERCHIWTAGGGGMGNPLERDPMHVAADVAAGLVSCQQALECYGTLIDPTTGHLDMPATQQLRASLRRMSDTSQSYRDTTARHSS